MQINGGVIVPRRSQGQGWGQGQPGETTDVRRLAVGHSYCSITQEKAKVEEAMSAHDATFDLVLDPILDLDGNVEVDTTVDLGLDVVALIPKWLGMG